MFFPTYISILVIGANIVFVILGAGFNIYSVFSQGWFSNVAGYEYSRTLYSHGIIPYDSKNPNWFKAVSGLMCTSLALYILDLCAVVYLVIMFRLHGFSHLVRKVFKVILILGMLVVIIMLIAWILAVANAPNNLGHSFYWAVSSSFCAGGSVSLSLQSLKDFPRC